MLEIHDRSLLQWGECVRFDCLKELQWWHSGGQSNIFLAAVLSSAPLLHIFGYPRSSMGRVDSPVRSRVKIISLCGYLSRYDLSWIASAFPNVEDMQLKLQRQVPGLFDLILQCPRLKRLAYSVNEARGSPHGLNVTSLAQGCRMLTHLMLTSATTVTDADMEALCSNCTGLELLHIIDNQHITTASLQSLSTHLAGTLKHLKSSHLLAVRVQIIRNS